MAARFRHVDGNGGCKIASKRQFPLFESKHRSLDAIHESVPCVQLNVAPAFAVQANVDHHDVRKLGDETKQAFEYPRSVMLADNPISDPPATTDEFLRMDLLAQEDAMILLENRPVLSNARKALAPFSVSNADSRQAESVRVK